MAKGNDQTKLLDMCSGAILKKIGANADKLTATFCYGGAVDIPSDGLKLFYMQTKNETSQAKVLDIPLQGGREEDFLDLLSDCEEATFGRKKEDVLDPSYRKALKLGKDYSCTFNLSEYSILSEIQRVMAPDALYIRAELHKLNIYRTGDFFKSHVDTPRREDMFASLVVCLPFEHEGGELHIRHGSVTSVIDWSSKSGSAIQWVALYSDCEHEVKEVTSKYRVTLTYNLYADVNAPGPEKPFGAASDVRHVPLYQTLVEALGQQSFMYDGGRLGFMCQHRYPHTSHAFAERPAPLLKGADAVLFAVATALGLHVRFVHLYKLEAGSNKEEDLMAPLSIPWK